MDTDFFINLLIVIGFILYSIITVMGKKDQGTTASSEELGIEVGWEADPHEEDWGKKAPHQPSRPKQATYTPPKPSYGEKLSSKFNTMPEPRNPDRIRLSQRTEGRAATLQAKQVRRLLKTQTRDIFFAKEILDKPLSLRDQ